MAGVFKVMDIGMRWLSVTVGAVKGTDATKLPAPLSAYVKTLQTGWLVPAVLIVTPIAVWLRRKTDKGQLDAVHELLDQICDATFTHEHFDHEQHRRVTLFKHRRFYWRWPFFGGWLVPIERSGELTRKTDAVFYAPDDGEKCEGVAGRAWSRQKRVYIRLLPDLRAAGVTDDNFERYAEMSFVSAKRLRKRPPQARSLCGIPVSVGNKRWGVIVIDSVKEAMRENAATRVFNQLAPTLSRNLKGI